MAAFPGTVPVFLETSKPVSTISDFTGIPTYSEDLPVFRRLCKSG
jgi:hypothetical protein